MIKCNFCKKSSPNECSCRGESEMIKEIFCEKAIERMIKTFENIKINIIDSK